MKLYGLKENFAKIFIEISAIFSFFSFLLFFHSPLGSSMYIVNNEDAGSKYEICFFVSQLLLYYFEHIFFHGGTQEYLGFLFLAFLILKQIVYFYFVFFRSFVYIEDTHQRS